MEELQNILNLLKEFFVSFWTTMNSHWVLQIILYGAILSGIVFPIINRIRKR